MAEVVLQGQGLIDEIDATECPKGQVAFWWMGQNSFVYKGAGKVIYVDLAGNLRPRLAVPMHYDMFAGNSEDPAKFVDYLEAKYPGIATWVGPAGQRQWIGAAD